MIYLFPELDTFTKEDFRHALSLLPPTRQEYALHFRREVDQKKTVISYLLLLHGLRTEFGIHERPDIAPAPSGKPFLLGKNMPFFSISHSGSYVACALHSKEIGLDIQKTVPLKQALVRRVCTQPEQEHIKTAADFCSLWTKKESVAKLTGEGIGKNFTNILELYTDISTETISLEDGAYFLSWSIKR